MKVEGSTQTRVSAISIAKFCRPIDEQHLRYLKRSFQEFGQLVPIAISENGSLIDGRHRLEAARLLGWERIRVTVIRDLLADGEEVALHINGIRKPMTPKEVHQYVGVFELKTPPSSHQTRWEPYDVPCENCEVSFTPKGPKNRFCSPECRLDRNRSNRAMLNAENLAQAALRTCAGCEVSLAGRSIRARFCNARCRTRTWKKNR